MSLALAVTGVKRSQFIIITLSRCPVVYLLTLSKGRRSENTEQKDKRHESRNQDKTFDLMALYYLHILDSVIDIFSSDRSRAVKYNVEMLSL